MKKQVSNLNIDKFFIFTGLIENRELLAKIYNRADLSLMVSLFDVNSLTIYESASQCTPMILVKNSTVVNNLMKDKKNCYLSSLSPNKFADIIASAIKNKNKNSTIGINANKDLYKD
jgi:glycosyltransferase involved in cell wall biosynthesis